VDARLRPHGGEGELVVTAAELRSYCAQEALAWEALTFTKLRPIAGSPSAAGQAEQAVRKLGERFAGDDGFTQAVRDMRLRLEHTEPSEENFKTSPGAVYDIDFLVGYLAIRHQLAGACGNLRQRLRRLSEAKFLNQSDSAALDRAAELFRAVEHAVRLVTGKARKSLPGTEQGRAAAERLSARLLRRDLEGGLEAELTRTFAEVRAIYERLMR
jgi:glutamine synthetase adenylyltransferase